MRKVLQINTVINTGSTGKIAEGIGQIAAKRGWDSTIAFGRYGELSQSKMIRIGSNLDNYLHVIYTRFTDKHGFASSKATQAFIEELKVIKPDIVHLHNIHGYYLNVEILFSYLKSANIPVVWTLHDCWSFTGHCCYYIAEGCSKWETQCFKCPQISSYPQSFIDNSRLNYTLKKKIFSETTNLVMVPVSNWLSGELNRSFLKHIPSVTIKNGIDIAMFNIVALDGTREKYNITSKHVLLGVASPWVKRKGLDEFVKLSHTLENDEVIVLVGLSKQQISALPSNIIGVTKTESAKELAALYSLATVFLNLTFEDNYPTTNLEAMACGTPVVTYKTGGSPEVVCALTGYVVEQGDLLDLRNKINLIKHTEVGFYERNCRQKAILEFDKNKKYDEYVNLYESLIEQSYDFKG